MANPYLAKNLRHSARFLETRYIRYASLKIDSILLNHMRLQFIPLPLFYNLYITWNLPVTTR